jgi:predicted nucleic-acid-binding protein
VSALDTNTLVRLMIQDDKKQCARVNRLFQSTGQEKAMLIAPLLVTLELIRVLQSVYEVQRTEILTTLDALLQLPVLEFQNQPVVREFITRATQSNAGLADLLIGETSRASGCEAVLTLDKVPAESPLFTAL